MELDTAASIHPASQFNSSLRQDQCQTILLQLDLIPSSLIAAAPIHCAKLEFEDEP